VSCRVFIDAIDELLFELNESDIPKMKEMIQLKACNIQGAAGIPLKIRFKSGKTWGCMEEVE
jgi:DNA polymerase I-like protein with 3'-5' exonuclease and polymerase domains